MSYNSEISMYCDHVHSLLCHWVKSEIIHCHKLKNVNGDEIKIDKVLFLDNSKKSKIAKD